MIPLGFLLLGGAFVATLLNALWTMISKDWGDEPLTAGSIFQLFKWALLSLVLLILFIAYGIPFLEPTG